MPYRIYGQTLDYLWRAPLIRSWEQAYLNGECNEIQSIFWNTKPVEELYDTENDPWEITNLAGDSAYNDVLERMRDANKEWVIRINEAGFIPEAAPAKENLLDALADESANVVTVAAEACTLYRPAGFQRLCNRPCR